MYLQLNSIEAAQNIKASFTVMEKIVLLSTKIMTMTIFHHQESEDFKGKTKPRELLETFHYQNGMIVLMKHHPII